MTVFPEHERGKDEEEGERIETHSEPPAPEEGDREAGVEEPDPEVGTGEEREEEEDKVGA